MLKPIKANIQNKRNDFSNLVVRLSLIVLIIITSSANNCVLAEGSSQDQKTQKQTQQDTKEELKGHVNEGNYIPGVSDNTFNLSVSKAKLLGFEFGTASKNKLLPATITKVDLNGAAYKAGIRAGDKWLYGNVQDDSPLLILEHAGKLYQARINSNVLPAQANKTRVSMPVSRINLNGGIPTQAPSKPLLTKANNPVLPISADDNPLGKNLPLAKQMAILAKRQVVIIIDKSGSMATEDCPGGKTRWQWCADQTRILTKQANESFKNGMTICVFSNDYHTYENVNVRTVQEIFSINEPQGGTHPEFPLKEQLDRYFSYGRSKGPLSIAIVTDGEPNDPDAVANVIIDATKQMTEPGEVSIIFLKVGQGEEGDHIMRHYASDLTYLGAKFDIVDYKSFDGLQKLGLIGSLVEAVTKPFSAIKKEDALNTASSPSSGYSRSNYSYSSGSYQLRTNASNAQQQLQKQLNDAEQRRSQIEDKLLK